LTRGFLVWAWLYQIAVNCRWPLLDRGRPAITPRPRFRLSAFGTRRGWRKGRSIWCTSPPARTGTRNMRYTSKLVHDKMDRIVDKEKIRTT